MRHAQHPPPVSIVLRTESRCLHVDYGGSAAFDLPFEYLRVSSPSAEVQGHGPGQETLQIGKENVVVTGVEPVGLYAIRLIFSDGHNSGLYTWKYLRELGEQHAGRWAEYLDRLAAAGYPRRPN